MATVTGDFPFDMADVVSLLDITIRRSLSNQLYTDCPFCGKRGKMNINLEKNAFRCNYCDKSGGMLALFGSIYGISNGQAYRQICELLDKQLQAPAWESRKPLLAVTPNTPAVSKESQDKTFSTLLTLLSLSESHRQKLRERGLTDQQIDLFGFRSAPAYGYVELANKLKEKGCVISGVPGFYPNKQGYWQANFHPRCTGILIPVRALDGKIAGFQTRLDNPITQNGHKTKYIWFSSGTKAHGTSSGSPIHFIGDRKAKIVYVTEGALKAYITHALTGNTFIARAGANQHHNLDTLFQTLKQNGTEEIWEANDMDKFQNIHVMNGSRNVIRIAKEAGLKTAMLNWTPILKGIDDYEYVKRRFPQAYQEILHLERFLADKKEVQIVLQGDRWFKVSKPEGRHSLSQEFIATGMKQGKFTLFFQSNTTEPKLPSCSIMELQYIRAGTEYHTVNAALLQLEQL